MCCRALYIGRCQAGALLIGHEGRGRGAGPSYLARENANPDLHKSRGAEAARTRLSPAPVGRGWSCPRAGAALASGRSASSAARRSPGPSRSGGAGGAAPASRRPDGVPGASRPAARGPGGPADVRVLLARSCGTGPDLPPPGVAPGPRHHRGRGPGSAGAGCRPSPVLARRRRPDRAAPPPVRCPPAALCRPPGSARPALSRRGAAPAPGGGAAHWAVAAALPGAGPRRSARLAAPRPALPPGPTLSSARCGGCPPPPRSVLSRVQIKGG